MDGSAVYTIEVRPTRREYFQLWILFLFPLEISPSRSVFFKWKSQLSWSSLQSEVWSLRSLYCTSEAQSSSSKLHRCSHLSAPGATLQEQYLKPRVCFQQRSYLARRKQSLMTWWRGEKEKNIDFYCRTLKGNTLIVMTLKECDWRWDQTFPWLSFGSFSDSFLTTWKIKPAFYNFNNQRPPTASPINISE